MPADPLDGLLGCGCRQRCCCDQPDAPAPAAGGNLFMTRRGPVSRPALPEEFPFVPRSPTGVPLPDLGYGLNVDVGHVPPRWGSSRAPSVRGFDPDFNVPDVSAFGLPFPHATAEQLAAPDPRSVLQPGEGYVQFALIGTTTVGGAGELLTLYHFSVTYRPVDTPDSLVRGFLPAFELRLHNPAANSSTLVGIHPLAVPGGLTLTYETPGIDEWTGTTPGHNTVPVPPDNVLSLLRLPRSLGREPWVIIAARPNELQAVSLIRYVQEHLPDDLPHRRQYTLIVTATAGGVNVQWVSADDGEWNVLGDFDPTTLIGANGPVFGSPALAAVLDAGLGVRWVHLSAAGNWSVLAAGGLNAPTRAGLLPDAQDQAVYPPMYNALFENDGHTRGPFFVPGPGGENATIDYLAAPPYHRLNYFSGTLEDAIGVYPAVRPRTLTVTITGPPRRYLEPRFARRYLRVPVSDAGGLRFDDELTDEDGQTHRIAGVFTGYVDLPADELFLNADGTPATRALPLRLRPGQTLTLTEPADVRATLYIGSQRFPDLPRTPLGVVYPDGCDLPPTPEHGDWQELIGLNPAELRLRPVLTVPRALPVRFTFPAPAPPFGAQGDAWVTFLYRSSSATVATLDIPTQGSFTLPLTVSPGRWVGLHPGLIRLVNRWPEEMTFAANGDAQIAHLSLTRTFS